MLTTPRCESVSRGAERIMIAHVIAAAPCRPARACTARTAATATQPQIDDPPGITAALGDAAEYRGR
jgi:hypothetical protein